MSFVNGDLLSGNWKGAMGIDFGTHTYNSESEFASYEGQIEDFKTHGKGILIWKSGDQYEGDFVDGLLHGEGSKQFFDGSILRGTWVNGSAPSNATIVYDNNSTLATFEGDLIDGQKWGFGKLVWKDGCSYEGQFERDRMHGFGKMKFRNVELENQLVKYEGDFFEDDLAGNGSVFLQNGDICSGTIENNSCYGNIEFAANGSSTVGSLNWNLAHLHHDLKTSKLKLN
jgi:hypothetical protein